MTQRDREHAIAAHHEAGHAVVANRLGLMVRSVSIAADGGGLTKLTGVGSGERAILITLAGPYAQRRYAPHSRWRWRNHLGFLPQAGHARDFDIVTALIGRMEHGTVKVSRAYRRYVEVRAEELVEQYWQRIEAVAQALIERRTLTGDEMKVIFAKLLGLSY